MLTLVWGALYVGWYRWPGWYLADVLGIVGLMAGVDVAFGPLLTLVVASPGKRPRVLARDIGVIVTVQLIALLYGSATLWSGRPLYYTFSADRLELVRAIDLEKSEIVAGLTKNPALAPHWYSLPRWVWAPLPDDPEVAARIVESAVTQGKDVIGMPRYFRPWADGLPSLRTKLSPIGALPNLSPKEQARVKDAMHKLRFPVEAPITMFMPGRGDPLVAVFDAQTMQIQAILRAR